MNEFIYSNPLNYHSQCPWMRFWNTKWYPALFAFAYLHAKTVCQLGTLNSRKSKQDIYTQCHFTQTMLLRRWAFLSIYIFIFYIICSSFYSHLTLEPVYWLWINLYLETDRMSRCKYWQIRYHDIDRNHDIWLFYTCCKMPHIAISTV